MRRGVSAAKTDKSLPPAPMELQPSRASARDLESALDRLGVSLQAGDKKALFHLAELSETFETVQSCLEAIAKSRPLGGSEKNRLELITRVSQWLADVQGHLYTFMPLHTRPLKGRISALLDRVCALEGDLEKRSRQQ